MCQASCSSKLMRCRARADLTALQVRNLTAANRHRLSAVALAVQSAGRCQVSTWTACTSSRKLGQDLRSEPLAVAGQATTEQQSTPISAMSGVMSCMMARSSKTGAQRGCSTNNSTTEDISGVRQLGDCTAAASRACCTWAGVSATGACNSSCYSLRL